MRDSNSIKKEEKHIPHFRRTELFPSGGGKPEGKEGEQYSHVRGLHSFSPSSPPHSPSGCCLQERSHPLPVTLTLSFGCRTRKRNPCKGLAYLIVRAPPICPMRKSMIFPRGPRVGAFDAVMRQMRVSVEFDAEKIAQKPPIIQKLRAADGYAGRTVVKEGERELKGLLEILFEPGDAGGTAG